jgi:hypothetical protein
LPNVCAEFLVGIMIETKGPRGELE